MSPDILAALAISMAPTIAVVVTNMFSMAANRKAAKESAQQIQRVNETTSQTHTIVNNQRTVMLAEIEKLKLEIVALKSIITKS